MLNYESVFTAFAAISSAMSLESFISFQSATVYD
jgi:hypothetical protein